MKIFQNCVQFLTSLQITKKIMPRLFEDLISLLFVLQVHVFGKHYRLPNNEGECNYQIAKHFELNPGLLT